MPQLLFYPPPSVPARVLRDLSAVGKTPKKICRREFCLYLPETGPRLGRVLPVPLHLGVLPASSLTSLWAKLSAARDLRFRSKLKLHFQKWISTSKSATCEKNQQLRNNFWEVATTLYDEPSTFRVKVTTLLQNEANTRRKPLLWHKKIFML